MGGRITSHLLYVRKVSDILHGARDTVMREAAVKGQWSNGGTEKADQGECHARNPKRMDVREDTSGATEM
jgi:hypothetical protein